MEPSRTRPAFLAAALAGAALIAPASAGAAPVTRYVDQQRGDDIPACGSQQMPCETITHMVANSGPFDTIDIAEGTYAGSVVTDMPLHFVGDGSGTQPGSTVITGGGGAVALQMTAGGSVRNLRAHGGAGGSQDPMDPGDPPGPGITLESNPSSSVDYLLENVVAIGGDSAGLTYSGGAGLVVSQNVGEPVSFTVTGGVLAGGDGTFGGAGAFVSGAAITGQVNDAQLQGGGSGSIALHTILADVVLARSELEGGTGIRVSGGTLDVLRSEVQGAFTGMSVSGQGSEPVTATVTDSLVYAPDGPDALAAFVSPQAQPAALTARGSTFVAGGPGVDAAVKVMRTNDGQAAGSADLRNSIARADGFGEDLEAVNTGNASPATITADFSSFTIRGEQGGGTVTAPGSGSNVSGDPGFANVGAGDYSLAPSSPLIDRGDPTIVSAGQLDLAGNLRSADGNGDCSPVPDIGALERADRCLVNGLPGSNSAPRVNSFGITNRVFAPLGAGRGADSAQRRRRARRGTRFTYALSEAARVAISIERPLRGRRVRRRGRVRCVKPTRRNRRARRCVRYRRVGTLRANGAPGPNSLRFSGRIRNRALRPGRYRATIVATDAQGARSAPRRLRFRVVRR